ncbi:hypothetical protein K466DRAFT_636921 [Polyporus arcularius HHB13444]|uniref:Uncharacterized protein n=1 Tax=Polyporus arcularius HHB13444 TaxID=1314778 RepID=A0A5C3NTD2_9APHY|nr:hypothetical protein K466DRAFT_636921 [Polyporus arcularius HHB13444]
MTFAQTACVDDHEILQLQRPLSPVLTARARLETPRAGKSALPLPQTDGELLRSCKIAKVEVIPLPDPSVRTDDALGNKLTIDPATHRDVVTLIQSIPAMSARPQTSARRPYEDFLRAESPPIDDPEPAMLPLFPRDQRLGRGHKEPQQGAESFCTSMAAALGRSESWIVPVQVKEEEDEDIANEHLVLVSGWQAFKTPSSPLTPGTPSLADTSSDIDELFLPSSSIPYTAELEPFGVSPRASTSVLWLTICEEEYQIPRCERIGGSRSHPKLPGQDTDDDFIMSAVQAVERACGDRVGDEDPINLILEEKLDEKDGLLMDVPNLRPPNQHFRDIVLPDGLLDLLAPGKSGNATAPEDISGTELYMRCIKKVKGLGPLQIELSWIPFKYGRTVPTDEEVADVANDACPQLTKAIDLPYTEIVSQLALLLDETTAFSSQPVATAATYSEMVWSAGDQLVTMHFDAPALPGLVLARGDRRRLAGLPAFSEDEEDAGSSDKENECEVEGHPPSDHERPVKRVRFQDSLDETSAEPILDMVCHDSGVFMVDEEEVAQPGSDGSGSFGQLAYDAEGFVGPTADGNLFPDVHPVYFDEYNFDMSPRQYVLDPYASAWTAPSPSPLDLLADHCAPASQMEEVEGITADGPQPQDIYEEFIRPADALPLLVTSADLLYTFTRPSHHQDTATVAVMRTDGYKASAAALALPALSARQSLDQFLTFCGKGSLVDPGTAAPASSQPADHAESAPCIPDIHGPRTAPETPAELLDDRTLLLSDDYEPSGIAHRYMASMTVIQKRALVRALAAYCAVELIEREHLGADADEDDVHIIIDADTAVLFFSLEMLPSRGDAVAALLTRLSWRYSRLLVIFECYPSSWDYTGDRNFSDKLTASAWSPPVVKAVRKLRRDLSISEGIQTKSAAALVEYAFANTVEEAAAFTRLYGDTTEAQDRTSGAVWGERLWLTHEERDGEYDLAGVPGMNLFAASLLLSQTTLEAFLEKTASERLVEYGALVGAGKIERFNVEMAHRLEIMQLPPSSPIETDASSSLNSVPYIGDSDIGVEASYADDQYQY